ncbi:CDP-alcohol phosphatidyltransferase family protein [Streptomonospora nanhaiensis]|uniref:CDP-alcohol phosphatidyltransferase family protein n=1 Tax=Streptomonospora nanhaiensis TaxID=1323731 RepID=UPI001C38EA78|nr:CDP-alcohol phosphatidyltransferase family protein [Streptomonospora nanhaiensis]MBV2367094.1 CDP-alcohol phosphatidyltransferase family protein [Streptomonospora nanhaiensis]MBX9389559.1 CDP-alcohol phosphatidyltransferase family protein [Streptomonospora nanhaiensis]
MPRPSVAEVRAGGQPEGVKERVNEEHWVGRLYMRDISPYLSTLFVRLGVPPNPITYLMMVCGVLAGVVLAFGGLWSALAALLLVQVYLLLDCSDGEVARFTGRTSTAGIYLDRIGHYLAEIALLIGLGIRAQGEFAAGDWVVAGMAAALGAAVIKVETDNVVVARAKAGLPEKVADAALQPRSAGLGLARKAAAALRFHRVIQAVELSLLVAAVAVVDAVRGDLLATRALVAVCVAVAVLQSVLHLVSVLASRRLE